MTKSSSSPRPSKPKKRGRPSNQERQNNLVVEHIYLVKYVANRLTTNLPPGVSKDDILSMGTWGLIDAAKKFNRKRGVLFKTYALTRIRGAIIDELRRNTLGGQALCRKARQLEKAVSALEETNDTKDISDEMVAKELGVSDEKLQQMYYDVARSFVLSLDQSSSKDDDDSSTFVDSLSDKNAIDPFKSAERRNLKEIIIESLKQLHDQERKVILMYYYESLNFREIGLVLNVSESRVSQIHTKAISHMRVKLKRVLER